jgi:hypothetical protein
MVGASVWRELMDYFSTSDGNVQGWLMDGNDYWYVSDGTAMRIWLWPAEFAVSSYENPAGNKKTQLLKDQYDEIFRMLQAGWLLYSDGEIWSACYPDGTQWMVQMPLWRIANEHMVRFPPKFVPKLRPATGFKPVYHEPAKAFVETQEAIENNDPFDPFKPSF